jgi:hypothetical protein
VSDDRKTHLEYLRDLVKKAQGNSEATNPWETLQTVLESVEIALNVEAQQQQEEVTFHDCFGKVVPLSEMVLIDKGWIKMGFQGSTEPSGWVHDPVRGHIFTILNSSDLKEGIEVEGAVMDTQLLKYVLAAFERIEDRLQKRPVRKPREA